MFQHQKIRPVVTMQLDASLIVPFNAAAQLFAVLQDDDHRSAVVHLLLVVEAFGMSLLRGHTLAVLVYRLRIATLLGVALIALTNLSQRRSDQFSVHHTSSRSNQSDGYQTATRRQAPGWVYSESSSRAANARTSAALRSSTGYVQLNLKRVTCPPFRMA